MKAAVYVRVSTEAQTEKFSLPAQKKMLTEYCERQGWTYTLFEDAGISGETIEARPAFLKLLKDAEAKRFDVALAVEMERFSRDKDMYDWLKIGQIFGKAGIKFGTPSQLLDANNDEDWFMSVLFGALSAREKKKLLARSMRGKTEATRQGRYIGSRAPFGYYVDHSTLLIAEKEAKIVRRIFTLAQSGMAGGSIRDLLNSEGVPTPAAMRGDIRAGKYWWEGGISKIIRDRTYIGEAQWNGTPFKVPAIVDVGTFEAVQKSRASRVKMFSKRSERIYPLSGLLFCAECGARLHGESVNKGKNRYYSHRLEKSKTNRRHRWRADRLEEAVSTEAMKILMAPETVAKLAKEQTEFGSRDEVLVRLDAVADQITELPAARERITDAYQEGTIDKAEWKRRLSDLEDRKARLEAERDTLQAQAGQQVADEAATKQVAELLSRYESMVVLHSTTLNGAAPINTAAYLKSVSPNLKIADLRTLIRKVTVKLDGSLKFEGLIPLCANESSSLRLVS
jgi:site-specific DNA recombinase